MSIIAELDEIIKNIPYLSHIGLEFEYKDSLKTIMPYKSDLIGNPMLPALHGGVIAAALEFTAVGELMIAAKTLSIPKTIDISVDYLRSGKPEDTYCRASITKIGRAVANVEAYAFQSDESKPIAKLHGHFLLMREG